MKIADIEIRACRHNDPVMKDSEMRDGKKSELEFLVITFHTDEGLSTSTFGFAGRGAAMAGEIANSIFKPFFIGRDPLYREKHWHESGTRSAPVPHHFSTHLAVSYTHLTLPTKRNV